MRTIVVFAVLCSICVAVSATSTANGRTSRSRLQLQSKMKVKAETPDLNIMRAVFGIVAETFQSDSINGRGNNIATILGYYSAQQDKTIPFAWGLNCVGIAGKKVGKDDKKWPHGERVALDLFEKFCEENEMPVAACQDLWSNVVVYSTLQPCSMCSVELGTYMGKPPKAVYYGSTDGAVRAGVGSVFSAKCAEAGNFDECKLKVTATEAADYRDDVKFKPRADKYADYLKELEEDEVAQCKAGYLKPSKGEEGETYPEGFEEGKIKDYISKDTTVAFYRAWAAAGGKFATDLVGEVPTDGTCEGFFAAGKKAVVDAVRKQITDKCSSCFKSKGDKKLYFCKYTKAGKPHCLEMNPANNGASDRRKKQGKIGCLETWHTISEEADCAENKLYV